MVEKFTCYCQQRKVVRTCIHEKLDGCMVNTESQCLQERDEGINQLFIVKVELERDKLVEEGVRQDVVYTNIIKLRFHKVDKENALFIALTFLFLTLYVLEKNACRLDQLNVDESVVLIEDAGKVLEDILLNHVIHEVFVELL